jgi:hypothetical protein
METTLIVADTKEEIEESLVSLEAFNAMLSGRRKAGYEDHMYLQEFYIFGGRFHLDTCGNVMKSKISFPTFEKVLTHDEFFARLKIIGHDEGISYSGNSEIPPSGKICPICKRVWTIENFIEAMVVSNSIVVNLKDFIGKTLKEVREIYGKKPEADYFGQSELAIRNDKFIDLTPKKGYSTLKENERGWMDKVDENYVIQQGDETHFNVFEYFHKKCLAITLEAAQFERFKALFTKAGFFDCTFKPIPNRYCKCERCTAWYEVKTPLCDFVIGDRKRVTNLEWTAKVNGEKLFKDELVTKETNLIHAWDDDKIVEYLIKIRNEL